jgi:inosine-uridine nucleoside N-ribohydrolase
MPIKVIHDTDIGSDIDDAVALAYLLAQEECELVGVTTVTGDTNRRAMLASALCKVAGKEIPIYPGAKEPLVVPQRQPHVPQAAALERWPHETQFPQDQAVAFLRRTIRENPGEIVLLATGPMTNVAQLFQADPETPALLRALVMMCGVVSDDEAKLEWNVICDPHASAITYQAQAQVHRSIGLQVTRRVRMPAAQVRERFQTTLLRPVLNFAEVWFESVQEIIFHDPLAAATIFDNTICRFERGCVEVDLEHPILMGRTVWTPGDSGSPHEVAMDVDPERFFTHYFSVF